MPCNFGFRSFNQIVIPAPQPEAFKAKAEAPSIDADLLAKLGNEDPDFLEWINEFDTKPLLQEALDRALAKVPTKGLKFTVNAKGQLEVKGSYVSAKEQKSLSDMTAQISEQWQFEIIGIVAELLGYATPTITQKGKELTLVAEEEGKSHPCNYLKVEKQGERGALVFEHFKSRQALDLETAKFTALAQKLGVKITLGSPKVYEGNPLPGEEQHVHHHRQKN